MTLHEKTGCQHGNWFYDEMLCHCSRGATNQSLQHVTTIFYRFVTSFIVTTLFALQMLVVLYDSFAKVTVTI